MKGGVFSITFNIILGLVVLLFSNVDVFGFGKNKVNHQIHDWYIYDLGNYKLFIDITQTNLSKLLMRAVKDADEELRGLTLKDLNEVFPVIIFPNQIDFQANNISDNFIDEGIGGFTEGLKNRVVIPLNGNWGFFRRILKHEMVHAYQFDSLKSPQFRRFLRNFDVSIPLWFIEGMAEYYSADWDFSSEEIIRDVTINNMIVPLSRLSDINKLSPKEYYLVYKQGQAFLKYVGDRFGKPVVYKIFKAYLTGSKDPFKAETGIELKDIEKSFVYETRKKYLSLLSSYDEVSRFARSITSEAYGEETYSKFIPTFVSTNLVAFLTYKDIYPKVVLYDINQRKVVKTLVIGGFNENYLEFHISRNNISASTNGVVVFVSKSGGKDAINVYYLSNNTTFQIGFDGIRIISSPDVSVDGKLVTFSGFDGNKEDIYLYNLDTRELRRLTDDLFYDSEPRISSDGKYIYFVTSRNKSSIFSQDTDIYRIEVDTGKMEKFIDIGGEEQNPFLSVDGKYLVFVSTIDGVRNIFVYSFEELSIRRFSKIVTGAFSPKLDISSTKIIFSSVDNLTYNLYEKEFSMSNLGGEIITNHLEISQSDLSNFSFESSRIVEIDYREASRYFIIPTVDYITGALTLSSDLGFILLLGLSFSDLLGDQRLSFMFNNTYVGGFETFSFTEMNYLLSYANYKYYFDFGFEVYNLRNYLFSLMNFFYLPSVFYEVEHNYYSKAGIFGFVSYPFSTFSRADLILERAEYFGIPEFDYGLFRYHSRKLYSLNEISLLYSYDSTLWTVVGPVNGIRAQVKFSYYPFLVEGDRSFFSFVGDFRSYFMITLVDTLAFRIVGGGKVGQSAKDMEFYLGGVGTIRGYEFGEFRTTSFLLSNLELRIALIRALYGPFGFSFPPVFASVFVDAGIIGDDPLKWQLTYFDEKEGLFKLRDLKVGVGIGISVLLGVGFKLKFDFASPFDGRRLLDYQNWKTYFQIGYEF
ncbi:MAG: hypothetical protein ABDH28_00470 [Brevinematia bacterium]